MSVSARSQAHQALGRPVVEPDRDPVIAQHRMVRGRFLQDGELGEPPLVVGGELRAQRVHAGGLQPLLGPAGQVPAGGVFERRQQIRQGRVAPCVLAEVAADPGQEVVDADVGHELLEHRRTLGVGDPVEVDLHRRDVGDVGRDRVGGGELVLPVGPGLVQLGERGPGRRPAGRLGLADGGGPGGEGLVQPQVVPPAHGDQVAEPHVRHLMQDRVGPDLPREVGDPRPEDVVLQERHGARVLHRARLELGHEELVVLGERIAHPERRVEEVEPLPGHLEDLVGIQVLGQRRPAVDAQRDAVVLGPDHVVGAGPGEGDVGGHRRRRREMPAGGASGRLAGRVRRHVRDHLPAVRHGDRELEGGLEVGLVEAGEDAVRVERLQVGVEVHAAVGGVGEPVQPLAAAGVGARRHHPQFVLRRERRQRDPVAVERVSPERLTVEGDLAHRRGGQVDEAGRAGMGATKAHRADRWECLLARGEVELHLVRDGLEQPGPVVCLVTGEVVRHGIRVLPRSAAW